VASVVHLLNLEAFLPLDRPAPSVEAHSIAAKREYSLLALVELSQGLILSENLFGAAEIFLLNLMGHLRPSGACLWLFAEGARQPVLVGTHGVRRADAAALMAACAPALLERPPVHGTPLRFEDLDDSGNGLSELVGRTGLRLLVPIAAEDELLGLLALGHPEDADRYGDLDLEILRASVAIAAMSFRNGRISGRLIEQNRELRLANERLHDLDRLKSEFLANVNHELRTPLTTIMTTFDCLATVEGERDNASIALLQPAREEAAKLRALIENVLKLAEAGSDSLALDLAEKDVAQSVEAYHRERLPGMTSGLREFTFTRGPGNLWARFDEGRLVDVLDAIVDNAVKFTPSGSAIQLRVHRVTVGDVPWVRIEVADNGPGIPPEDLPTLFEAFRQADGSSTRKFGGMGIGLSLARRLTERFGGLLEAASVLGRGSVFSVLLPARPE
jgi:signal transduction histidine kinase